MDIPVHIGQATDYMGKPLMIQGKRGDWRIPRVAFIAGFDRMRASLGNPSIGTGSDSF
jgi:hypothetical protein